MIAGIVFVLMQYVFPVIAPYMPFNDATVEEGAFAPAQGLAQGSAQDLTGLLR